MPRLSILLAQIVVILVLARAVGWLFSKIRQPKVIGEMAAGLLLGPSCLGWIAPGLSAALFPPESLALLELLSQIGLILFMFLIGLDLNTGELRRQGRVAIAASGSSIAVPFVLGIALSFRLPHGTAPGGGFAAFALFIGTAMAVTAFPVLARILSDRGMHRTRLGGLALASAAVDDVLAWSLLAVVVAIAGAGGQQLRLLAAPVYAAVMFGVARPALRKLADVYQRQGRLTPTVLATVLAGLLISSYATEWMGVKFIFGAFIFGVVMPRDAPAMRQEILERLEQVSVLVLLPVFFVVSGLKVNLSTIGLSGFWELCLILAAAVAGKFGGAFAGARLAGVHARQAGVLAALMNTRGLTGIVIVSVGLQLDILDPSLYSLMIAMAIVTTAMTGPLMKIIYPDRYVRRDIAEADRVALGSPAAHRILVLIDRIAGAGVLVEMGAALAASRQNSELVLSHLVAHRDHARLEVGTGLGGELLEMTRSMGELQALAQRASALGVTAVVQSRFSDDVAAELPGYVGAAEPDTIVLRPGSAPPEALTADGATQLVTLLREPPATPSAVAAQWARGANGAATVQVGAQLAVTGRLNLVLSPPGGRRAGLAAGLARRGIPATDGPPPDGALLVAAAGTGDGAHLTVLAGTREGSDDLGQWVQALEGSRLK